jgi:hypothetical protein
MQIEHEIAIDAIKKEEKGSHTMKEPEQSVQDSEQGHERILYLEPLDAKFTQRLLQDDRYVHPGICKQCHAPTTDTKFSL